MTLEDFFTLIEMKDGLTAPARVEELVALMQKEKDSLVKNVGDATRQWAAVASTIAATENKECLDLFIQLDGLWFIDRWLKDAQTFGNEASNCFVEEAISALLQAVEKLHIDEERLASSGICVTVNTLLSYNSTKVQDKARALRDSWKTKDAEKAAVYNDSKLIDECKSNSVESDDSPRTIVDEKLEVVDKGNVKSDQDGSQITSDNADFKDRRPEMVTSPVKLDSAQDDGHVRAELCPSDGKFYLQCPAAPIQGTGGAISEITKSEHVSDKARHDINVGSCADRSGKNELSSAFDSPDGRDISDDKGVEEDEAVPDVGTNTGKDELLVKIASVCDANRPLGESSNGVGDSGSSEQKALDQDDGSALEESKVHGTNMFMPDNVGKDDEVKRHHKSKKKRFGKSSKFSRLTKHNKNTDLMHQTAEMDIEDGTFDALEVARLVAKEVEREVVDYDEQSGSSSSCSSSSFSSSSSYDRISKGGIMQPDSLESINDEQNMQIDHPIDELSLRENLDPEPSVKEPVISSADPGMNPENHMQDMESSQVTDALREPESNTAKSFWEIDLNQEFSSEDLDNHQVDSISNPASVVLASKAAVAQDMPAGPLKFEGSLGWKGSAATSAFRPASPRRASNNDRALSGGGTSSGSRQRQDFLDIDLNVAEVGDDKVNNLVPGKQKEVLPGLASGESSVELSSKIFERPKFDLNQTEADGGVPAGDWKLGGRFFGLQKCQRSPSPASSSSCMQPSSRNFDLNDNPSNCHDPSDMQPFLGESSSNKVNPFVRPQDDSVISILGTKVKKSTLTPQGPLSFQNGRASEPVLNASLLRGGPLMGFGPTVPYAHSMYGYNGLAMGPAVPFSSAPMYGTPGPIPYMFDTRGGPFVPQIIGSASSVPSSYCQPSLVMNMMGTMPGHSSTGTLRPNVDLNSGYAVETGNREPAFFRQLFIPGHGRPLDDQLRDNLRPLSSGSSGGKRKEPDSGWELYPTNYKHHQPPHL